MKNIFKCLMIIIGTFIGAGFASGQEVASFFNRFSNEGLWGVILASILFGVVVYKVLNLKDIKKYEDLIKNNKFLLYLMKTFTFICFCIMVSGVGSFVEQEFSISFWIGSILVAIICFIAFTFKFNGLEKINSILVPIILVGVLIIGLNNYNPSDIVVDGNVNTISPFMNNWFIASILYVGYNSILLIPILIELKKYQMKKTDITLISVFIILIIGIMLFLIYRALNTFFPNIMLIELPTLELASVCGTFIKYYYGVVILFAIFTTAFSSGYAFLTMSAEKNFFRNNILMCICGVILARIGFADLINFFFPLFGYLGTLQILLIFLKKNGGK